MFSGLEVLLIPVLKVLLDAVLLGLLGGAFKELGHVVVAARSQVGKRRLARSLPLFGWCDILAWQGIEGVLRFNGLRPCWWVSLASLRRLLRIDDRAMVLCVSFG